MNLFKRAIGKIALAFAWPCEVAGSLLILELNLSFFFIIYGTAAAVAGVDASITDFFELGEGTLAERLDLLITWTVALAAFQLMQVAVWALALVETATTGRISSLIFKVLAIGIGFEGRFNAYYFMLTDSYPPLRRSSIERYPYRIFVKGPPSRFNRLGVILRPVIGLRSYVIYQLYSLWLELLSIPVLVSVIARGRVSRRLFNEQSRSELFSLRSNAYFSFITDTVPLPGRGVLNSYNKFCSP